MLRLLLLLLLLLLLRHLVVVMATRAVSSSGGRGRGGGLVVVLRLLRGLLLLVLLHVAPVVPLALLVDEVEEDVAQVHRPLLQGQVHVVGRRRRGLEVVVVVASVVGGRR